jgi:hypothetical protein
MLSTGAVHVAQFRQPSRNSLVACNALAASEATRPLSNCSGSIRRRLAPRGWSLDAEMDAVPVRLDQPDLAIFSPVMFTAWGKRLGDRRSILQTAVPLAHLRDAPIRTATGCQGAQCKAGVLLKVALPHRSGERGRPSGNSITLPLARRSIRPAREFFHLLGGPLAPAGLGSGPIARQAARPSRLRRLVRFRSRSLPRVLAASVRHFSAGVAQAANAWSASPCRGSARPLAIIARCSARQAVAWKR